MLSNQRINSLQFLGFYIFMIDLAFEPFQPGYKRCGCYVKSEEYLKNFPNKHVLVPLKSSEYELEIVNAITSVTLLQTYQNPTEKFLELEYSFPINPNACVYRFTAEFGKVRVEGIVKEKEEARKEYQEAVSQGKRAALGEINADSKDILTLKVGNVAPQEQVRIEISYLQELSLSNNTFYQLHIPGTISPRFMNFVPKEVIAKSCRNAALKTEGKFYWSFKISLRTTRKVVFFDSSSHDISLVSQNDMQTLSEFAMTESSVPNKDFVFTYTTEEFQLPSYVYGSTDVSSSAMLSFIPKFCSLNLDDAYKASVHGTSFETDIENAKGQYVFLLDRSGSMGGKRIQKAKEALILFIKSLPQDTYFNVISFGSGSSYLFPNSVKYNDKEVERAVQQVKKMSADMGGTEIYNPLKNLLERKPTEGYPRQIFLLTDGGVSNTQGVIKMVAVNNKYARVHTIAVGNGASQDLILGCAKSGKGLHVFITDDENPSEKIIQLLTDSLSPVISKMQLKYDKNVVQSVIPNPESLPYILKGELVNFYINFKGQLQEPTMISFSYEDSVTKLPYAAEMKIEPEPKSLPFVDKMGQFKKIRLMEEAYANNSNIEDYMFYVKVVDKKAEIVKESVRHQILSEFTAFVCVEQQLIDGKYAQIKNTGQISVLVENPKPIEYQEQQSNYRSMNMMKMSSPISSCAMPKARAMAAPRMAMDYAPMKEMAMECAPMKREMINCAPKMAMAKRPQANKSSTMGSISSFFGSIGSSISNAFSSKQKQSQPQQYLQAQMDVPKQEFKEQKQMKMKKGKKQQQVFKEMKMQKSYDYQSKQQMEDEFQNECGLFGMKNDLLDQMKEEKKKSIPQKSTITIESLIGLQSTEGSWKDLSLLIQLYSGEVEQRVSKGEYALAVLTYLVAKWIEKHHPQKQYSLVVKKALNFVKKEIPSHEQFLKAYDQYLQ